jgi:hypothetical protein
MEENIKVYVKVDSNNVIKEINSIIFIQDLTGWIKIDEGQGDKYAHAQGNYFPQEKPLSDMTGKYNYKLVDGKAVELIEEEKYNLFPPQPKQQILEEKQAELISDLVLDNLTMQAKLDSITLNVLGGN